MHIHRVFVSLAIPLVLGACAPSTTQSATPASTPTGGGQFYETSDFALTLPPGWRIFDPAKDRQALQSTINSLPPEQRPVAERALQQADFRLFALESESAGLSTLNLSAQRLGQGVSLNDLCRLLPQAYQQNRLEVLETQCNVNLSGSRALRFTVETQAGATRVRIYQYVLLRQGDEMWVLTLGTPSTLWESRRAVFEAIAATFRLR